MVVPRSWGKEGSIVMLGLRAQIINYKKDNFRGSNVQHGDCN